ncbi:MAG TPA: hypothetical protein VLY45_01140 [Nitrospiria bacterium]|nr:hypothetical protein [Nitrospiria bacterium]
MVASRPIRRIDTVTRHLSNATTTVLIGFTLAALACSHSSSLAGGEFPPAVLDKLDPALRHRMDELRARGQSDQRLSVLVRTAADISPDQEGQLERLGMTIHSTSGVILSATLPASSIPTAAALDYIVRIELAKRLKPREAP